MSSRIDDLEIFNRARKSVAEIYKICNENQYIRNDYSFKDQIRQSSISIVSNIAVGFERDNNKEFNKFLGYAKGSAGELKAQIIIAYDIHHISMDTKTYIENECDLLLGIIGKLRKYLTKNN